MPERIQRQRTKGWRMPEGAIYVGRPTKWGNPFHVGYVTHFLRLGCWTPVDVPDSETAVRLYRNWINLDVRCGTHHCPPPTAAELSDLRGHDLACWCLLDQPCHADVLLELANA